MVQVVYELAETWPADRPLLVTIPPTQLEVPISPDSARRRANGYLVTDVSMTLHAVNPMLVIGERPVWRLFLHMRLRTLGDVATLGTLDIDAQSGEVLPFTAQQIRAIQDQANALIARFSPTTTATI
jgi:hypothetical protein